MNLDDDESRAATLPLKDRQKESEVLMLSIRIAVMNAENLFLTHQKPLKILLSVVISTSDFSAYSGDNVIHFWLEGFKDGVELPSAARCLVNDEFEERMDEIH